MNTNRKIILTGVAVGVAYFIGRKVAEHLSEPTSIDEDNPYLASSESLFHTEAKGSCVGNVEVEKNEMHVSRSNYSSYQNDVKLKDGLYISAVKPALDRILSFTGLVVLSPLMLGIALAVYVDDPGPVFFTQKRVGCDCHYFQLHKFRTMKMATPADTPTHLLENPEQYITRVGAVLRRTSLDELPQIWDIFRGKMSIVSPRPALWNQDDLVLARATVIPGVDANAVLPGLTGLAQINGRDELEILDKARLDAEYVKTLQQGGWNTFSQDCRILFGTVKSVLAHDGVVEGGTGSHADPFDEFQTARTREMQPVNPSDAGAEEYGYKKHFSIDKDAHKKVLITGADSYIGSSFEEYTKVYYPNIEIDVLDMQNSDWKEADFSSYNTVFHVAGIAHADVGHTPLPEQDRYYAVNSILAIETAEKAKNSGVSQFIYMSSMIIYGSQEVVNEHTLPAPANFYGDSKWQGDKGVRELGSKQFNVAVLRPPMIYGKGSKGNYSALARLARKVPLFPSVENKRSVLYIENLCEFVAMLTLSGESGIYFPQNKEYSNTSILVQSIGEVAGKKVRLSKALTPAVRLAGVVPIKKVRELINKVFGSFYYDQKLSVCEGLDYQRYDLAESIKRTEG